MNPFNLPNTYSRIELKLAYKKAMSRFHPDKYMTKGDTAIWYCTEMCKIIKAEYEKLNEAIKRGN